MYNFRFEGWQQSLRIGKYPDTGLAEARGMHQQAQASLARGINPAAAKQQAEAEKATAIANTFQAIAGQWHTANLHRWKPNHAKRIAYYLEADVYPHISSTPIHELGIKDIKALTDHIIHRGTIETADKIRQWLG